MNVTKTNEHLNFAYTYIYYSRVERLIKGGGEIVLRGDSDKDDLYVAPTIIVDVESDDVVMQEEVHTYVHKYFICILVRIFHVF